MGTHPIFESDFDCLTEMAEKYGRLSGKWTKVNDSGFEKFDAKNPGLAIGTPGKNSEQIKLNYTINESHFSCEFSVDGGEASIINYHFDGPLEQVSLGDYIFTATTSVQEDGRMPGGQINIVYTHENGKEIKQENFQFHGPNRMIVETVANDAAMVTVFERDE